MAGYAGDKGMPVILDRYRPAAVGWTALRHTPATPESPWIAGRKAVAQRYAGNPS